MSGTGGEKNILFSLEKIICVGFLLFCSSLVLAATQFKVGETVFVAYPAGNIKDDAFIIGRITGVNEQGDYILSVIEYVEGHDYGLSCVPMMKKNTPNSKVSPYDTAWNVWEDTTVLDKEHLAYLVSAQDVMNLNDGKHLFIERNNLYIVFGRWKSDAPMLTAERLEQAEKEAQDSRIASMVTALQLAKQHRRSFYDALKRPKQAYETIAPLNDLLEHVLGLFKQDEALKQAWFSGERDWTALSHNSRQYFLLEAIDKIIADANDQLYEEELEKVDPLVMKAFKENLMRLQRKPRS